MSSQNALGRAGFIASLLGICGVALVGPFGHSVALAGIVLTFFALPGIVLSAMGLRRSPRRMTAWGLVIGIVAAMYLPTFCLTLFHGW